MEEVVFFEQAKNGIGFKMIEKGNIEKLYTSSSNIKIGNSSMQKKSSAHKMNTTSNR